MTAMRNYAKLNRHLERDCDGGDFCAYDGNGNVTALVNGGNGNVSATYEYGPFGELVRSSGTMAKVNPFRFSTKYQDDESDFLYYGYRSYNPSTGRWPNRDPLGDEAFIVAHSPGLSWREQLRLREESLKPLYAFVANNPIDQFDPLGLLRFDSKCDPKDIEKMKKDLKDKCEKAKKSNCFRCLKQKGQDALSKMCDEIDKNTGPKVKCEDASSDKGCKNKDYCGWERFGTIHVCVNLMSDTTINCSQPGCTLLHEGGHAVQHPLEWSAMRDLAEVLERFLIADLPRNLLYFRDCILRSLRILAKDIHDCNCSPHVDNSWVHRCYTNRRFRLKR